MMRALRGFTLFGGLAAVLTLFLVFGCSNNTPVQPDNPNPLELGKLFLGDPSPSPLIEYDSELINKTTGGTIDIERGDYTHQFIVEPYAIERDTEITVRSINEEVLGKEMIVFEFGPDGLEFSRSSTLSFEMAELSGISSTAYLYYYDPVRRQWILQDSKSISSGYVEFAIDHFSKYAISD